MRCVIISSSNIVTNIIVADPSEDQAPDNCVLVGVSDDSLVSFGWVYDPFTGQFTDPNPPAPRVEPIVTPVEGNTP